MPEHRGRFYLFVHHAAIRFADLPILRVHRHMEPPEGSEAPPLHDLHPGDVVEVAPITAGPTSPAGVPTEVATVVNHPALMPLLDSAADLEVEHVAYVQDASGAVPVASIPVVPLQTDIVETPAAPEATPQPAVLVSEPGTPEGEIPAVMPLEPHLTPGELEAIRDSPSGV
jgi:hypothetical protein